MEKEPLLQNQAAKKTGKTKKKKKRFRFWRFLGKFILVLFLLSVFFTLLYRRVNPPVTPLMVIRHVQYGYPIEKEWVPIAEISKYMPRAAIASEDNLFLGHHGFDVIAIDNAIAEHDKGGRRRGASTISQQTAKNVFLWPGGSWVRKGFETYYTFLIELFWPKERIMEVYLNVAEMGPGVYGAEAAARHHFHCHASQLTARQAALLTACYPNPLKYNAGRPGPYVTRQAGIIQQRMNTYGIPRFDKESVKTARGRYKKAVAKHREKKRKRKIR